MSRKNNKLQPRPDGKLFAMICARYSSEKQRRDNVALQRRAKLEGKMEVAKNLLQMNMSVNDIINATELTQKEIEGLSS